MFFFRKLIKHRGDVIKSAPSADSKTSGRRRPAPAPPVDKMNSEGSTTRKDVDLVVEGHRPNSIIESTKSSEGDSKKNVKHSGSKSKKCESHRTSAHSEICTRDITHDDGVKKSKSVTSSIGQAPSLVSSFSSDVTTTDSINDNSRASDGSGSDDVSHRFRLSANDETSKQGYAGQAHSSEKGNGFDSDEEATQCKADQSLVQSTHSDADFCDDTYPGIMPPPPIQYDLDESYDNRASISDMNDVELPLEDLPPPPLEDYDEFDDDRLPPAPTDLSPVEEVLKVDDMYVSLNSDILELCGRKPLEECCCDDFQPKFEPKGKFFAQ